MFTKKISSVFVAATVFCAVSLAGSRLDFTYIGAASGIPNNVVSTVCQDEFGMMWIGTQDGLIRYDGREMVVFRPEEGNPSSIYNGNVKALCSDGKGSVYVICKFALCRFDIRKEVFTTIRKTDVQSILHDGNTLWVATWDKIWQLSEDGGLELRYDFQGKSGLITEIFMTSDKNLYVGTNSGLFMVDPNGKVSEEYPGIWPLGFHEDSKHNLWVATRQHGVQVCSPDGVWISFRHDAADPNSLCSDYARTVCEDESGLFWIGTLSGLNVYDPESRKMSNAQLSYGFDPLSIYKIVRDRQNSIWICTKGGIYLYNRARSLYEFHDELFFDPRTQSVSDVAENDEYLFFATEESGLIRRSKASGHAGFFPAEGKLSSRNIQDLYMEPDGKTLWVGTRLGGLNCVDLETGAVKVWRRSQPSPDGFPQDNAMCISRYGDRMLLASNRDVVLLDPRTGAVEEVTSSARVHGSSPTDLLLDSDGNCWISVSEGLLRHNLVTGEEKEWFFDDKGVLGTNRIHVSFQDSKGRIWFGTSGSGLLMYDPGTEGFKTFTTANSMIVNDFIWAIAESRSGYLLLTSNGGFSKFDVENGTFYNYTGDSGFPMTAFSQRGLFVSASGDVYATGFKKVYSFRENRLPSRPAPRDIYFTSLEVGNRKVRPAKSGSLLKSSLLYQDEIVLKGGNTVFSVQASSPDFLYSHDMEYRLDGFDREWIKSSVGSKIVYTSLKPRKYVLRVRCKDALTGEVSASNSLTVKVRPYWYLSVAAKVFYALLSLSLVILILNFYLTRVKLRNSLMEEKREKDRIQEANQSKLRFFTYVSHELRTPVTLIQSQVDGLLSKNNVPPFIYNKVLGISRNLGRINSLLGELKDFRKQEQSGSEVRLSMSEMDIVPRLERVALVFKEYAASCGTEFEFEDRTGGGAVLWFDAEQMDKVLYNLISNAFKNTSHGGKVTLAVEQDDSSVSFTVSDTGCGIPEQYQDSIFQPFFQVPGSPSADRGTGLGLSITKGIVEAHGGSIRCVSTENIGTRFTVTIPKGDTHVSEGSKVAAPSEEDSAGLGQTLDDKFIEGVKRSRGDLQPSILIVEDNGELRDYLATLFAPIYSVTTACDGLDAWEKLSHNVPDIILSDLMMPRMDGNELCLKVKNNFYTSHIPFVILTAKVAEESILESLRNSADDYITKPFNPKILISKCNNLVNTRIGLQQKFAKSSSAGSELLATNEIDRDFIEKAMRIVRENLTDSEFDVGRFASEMALGRTLFFTKLKGLTGQTPNRFITTVRLKYARELLSDKAGHSVSEVSYMCGFSTPSYFIKTFKSFYGLTPSAFRDKI